MGVVQALKRLKNGFSGGYRVTLAESVEAPLRRWFSGLIIDALH